MIELPKIERDPEKTKDLCKCRPICKSRRREWKGNIILTEDELRLDRKPTPECFKRWPNKLYPNSPCPLFAKTNKVNILERNTQKPPPTVVRICQAPIDDLVDTTYLKHSELVKRMGAWKTAQASCPFCPCCACCPCRKVDYELKDEEMDSDRRVSMRQFDNRVKNNYQTMRIMYDKS